MATGACGINCEKCKLYRRGVCSSCGGGTSEQGMHKIATQKELLGVPCSILACANMNQIGHCLAECELFPCENFQNGPYPFSKGFLDMQKRRRNEQKKMDKQEGYQLPEGVHGPGLRGVSHRIHLVARHHGILLVTGHAIANFLRCWLVVLLPQLEFQREVIG